MTAIDKCKYKRLEIRCDYDRYPHICKGEDLWCNGYNTLVYLEDIREAKVQRREDREYEAQKD